MTLFSPPPDEVVSLPCHFIVGFFFLFHTSYYVELTHTFGPGDRQFDQGIGCGDGGSLAPVCFYLVGRLDGNRSTEYTDMSH